jgi:hypothetical protein
VHDSSTETVRDYNQTSGHHTRLGRCNTRCSSTKKVKERRRQLLFDKQSHKGGMCSHCTDYEALTQAASTFQARTAQEKSDCVVWAEGWEPSAGIFFMAGSRLLVATKRNWISWKCLTFGCYIQQTSSVFNRKGRTFTMMKEGNKVSRNE